MDFTLFSREIDLSVFLGSALLSLLLLAVGWRLGVLNDESPEWTWVPLDRISPNLFHAILLAEDDTFYQHHGFDYEQIQIAFAKNMTKHKYVYGGSTITQQLARTLFLWPRKSRVSSGSTCTSALQ